LRLGILRGLNRSDDPQMKSRILFSPNKGYLFLSHAAGVRLPSKGATGENFNMENVISSSPKKIAGDTRNNWVTMMFVTHNRYNCLRKQIYIDVLTQAFHDLERFGFEFGEFGFALNHVHFLVNIPKRYSIQNAEIMLKSYTARKMFEAFPGFRKRYPRGGFWSGYEHHESTGWKSIEQSTAYVCDQARHHNAYVIDETQQRLPTKA
jgi:REP element-mobilizing transposase RayT